MNNKRAGRIVTILRRAILLPSSLHLYPHYNGTLGSTIIAPSFADPEQTQNMQIAKDLRNTHDPEFSGLQLDVTHRAHLLTLDDNYTFSKTPVDIDVRNIFHATGMYALSFGYVQALLAPGPASCVVGGWSLQGIATAQDSHPSPLPAPRPQPPNSVATHSRSLARIPAPVPTTQCSSSALPPSPIHLQQLRDSPRSKAHSSI
jgi:hypothetical protein